MLAIETDGPQVGEIDLQHGKIAFRVGPHQFGARLAPIAKPHLDRIGRFDDMVVGQYIAIEARSEEHTSELQSLMRISYAVFCLKKKNNKVSQVQYINISAIKHTISKLVAKQ